MASIYFRLDKSGNKRYYGSIYNNGKRIRKFLGCSRQSAQALIKKFEYELLLNIESSTTEYKPISFEQAILSFKKDIERTGVKVKQISVIINKVNYFKSYCFSLGINELSEIGRSHASSYMNYRSATSLTPSTLNKEIGFIKRFFNHCIMMEWINLNPFFGIKYIKDRRNLKRYFFSDDDLSTIMNNANIYYDFYMILLNTGIRSTDAYSLKPEHIKDNYLVKQMNKTGDWLNIPLPATAQQILEKQISGEFIFNELQTSFQRRKCTEYLQSNFEPDFVRKNNINLHTFRHTYAHNMLNKGVPKEVLQTLLGHRSIKTTEIYANWVRKEELERWV
jgi:site-specific recombinase XerD